jgi:AraC-like DNA-binding protein
MSLKKSLDTTVYGAALLIPVKLLEFYGIDPSECLTPIGLSMDEMTDTGSRIKLADVMALWHQAQERIKDPCAGLNAIHFWHPSSFGALGYAILASSTLRSLLQRVTRYQQTVVESSDFSFSQTDKGMLLKQNAEFHQSGKLPMLVDAGMSTWLHICRFNYGEVLDPVEVNLKRSEPVCKERYFAMYRCPVNFAAPENSLTLPLGVMDKPLSNANKQLAQMHDQVLKKYLAQFNKSDLITQVQKLIISHLPSGEVNKEQIARALYMSNRTLHRRLQDEGTSFAQILNESRKELAIGYIQDDNMPLTEISFLLGFSDSAAFSRAFKRWTGKTPSESRIDI